MRPLLATRNQRPLLGSDELYHTLVDPQFLSSYGYDFGHFEESQCIFSEMKKIQEGNSA